MDSSKLHQKDKGQVTSGAARVYEEFFVPAMFSEWAAHMAEAAEVNPGESVLDVACGTGLLGRYFYEQVNGDVTGVDINDDMLAVASELAPTITWIKANAEALPFDDETFDAVACQFGLMFFTNTHKAIEEMKRVLITGRKMVLAIWNNLENIPAYSALIRLLQQEFGAHVADKLRTPFLMGNKEDLQNLFKSAGLEPTIKTIKGSANFPSIESWVYTEVRGWVLNESVNDDQLNAFTELAKKELSSFVVDGKVRFETSAHIITAVKN